MQRVTSYLPAGTPSSHPIEQVKLPHDLRHLRRKLLHLASKPTFANLDAWVNAMLEEEE